MMPLAPTPVLPVPSKPKIGFSIDSIVGGATGTSPQTSPVHYSESSAPLSPSSDAEQRLNGSPKNYNSPQRSPLGSPKPPIMVPGIPAHSLVRPNPTYDPNLVPKNGFLQPEMMHNHTGQHPFALAAHFQGAALAAALSGGQHGFPGQPSPLTHSQPRDSYPLYPWLLSRHGRIFSHRFSGGKSFESDSIKKLQFCLLQILHLYLWNSGNHKLDSDLGKYCTCRLTIKCKSDKFLTILKTNFLVRSLVQKRMYLYPTLSHVFEIVRQNTLVSV